MEKGPVRRRVGENLHLRAPSIFLVAAHPSPADVMGRPKNQSALASRRTARRARNTKLKGLPVNVTKELIGFDKEEDMIPRRSSSKASP